MTPRDADRSTDDDRALFHAAVEYYRNGETQGTIAAKLGVSRPTVSRMLAEARMRGIVTITLRDPLSLDLSGMESQMSERLGIAAYLVDSPGGVGTLTPGLARALSAIHLKAGDALLIASGRSVYNAVQGELPPLPGVVVAPTIGGQDEPAPWYQTNEIVRMFASRTGSHPAFLFAPAIPSPKLFRSLSQEPSIERVYSLWNNARAALVGVGIAPAKRAELPRFIAGTVPALGSAVGDVASRFIDARGAEVRFPGHDHYVALTLSQLRRIPDRIGIGTGSERVAPFLAAARAGLLTAIVTDTDTAELLLAGFEHGLNVH